MKFRKLTALLLSVLLLAGLGAGCAAQRDKVVSEGNYYTAESGGSGIYDAADKSEAAVSANSGALAERKLIKTVEIFAETEDLDEVLDAVTVRVSQLGGYVEYQRVHNGSAYASYRSRSAALTLRIPAPQLDEFVDHLMQRTNIVSQNAYIDDVTLTYVATESRVAALEAEHQRLLELLDQAETLSELLEIDARLTDVAYELESITSQLNILKNQVSYATVTLSIEEVVEYTPTQELTVWQRITGGFIESLKGIGNGIVECAVFLLANLPYLLLLAAVVAAVILPARRAWQKRKAKKAENRE